MGLPPPDGGRFLLYPVGMSRETLSALFAVLLAAPAFSAPVEAVRLRVAPAPLSAPAAAFAANLPALPVGSILSAAPAAIPAVPGAVPAAVRAPTPAVAPAVLPDAAPAAALDAPLSPVSARGPPRSAARVAATVAQTVSSWGVPVEQIFQDSDVMLIGENHRSLSAFDTLAREMPRLARAGVKAVGLEGLKRPNQEAVDDYTSGRTERLPNEALAFSPSRVDALEALLKAARANGVRVVALGLPLQEWATQVAALAAKNTQEPSEIFPETLAEQIDRAERGYEYGYNEAVAEVVLTRRNRSMATFLWGALGTGEKAVVVAGQAHVPGPDPIAAARFHVRESKGDLARELSSLALRSYALTFTGGLFTDVESAQDDREVRPKAHAAAAAASPQGAPAFVPLGADRGLWHAGGRLPVSPDWGPAKALGPRRAAASDGVQPRVNGEAIAAVQTLQSLILGVVSRRSGLDPLVVSLGLSAVGGLSVGDYLAINRDLAEIDANGQELSDAVDREVLGNPSFRAPLPEGSRAAPADLRGLRLAILGIAEQIVTMRNSDYLSWREAWAAGGPDAAADFASASLKETKDGYRVRFGVRRDGRPIIVHFDKSFIRPVEIAKHLDLILGSPALSARDRRRLLSLASALEANGLLSAGYASPAPVAP